MSAGLPVNGGTDEDQLMKEMEDVFGEEFAKQVWKACYYYNNNN